MNDTVKLPKHVAGVKIPKPLRHAVEALLEQAAGPAGRRLLAGALIAAAAALTRDLYAADADEAAEEAADELAAAQKPASARTAWDGSKIDLGALLGMATTVIGGLRAAGERKPEAAPTRPGEA